MSLYSCGYQQERGAGSDKFTGPSHRSLPATDHGDTATSNYGLHLGMIK